MLRVALVGAGNHSRANHAPSLRHFADTHPGTVRLAAVCDLDQARAERTRDEHGFERSCTGLEQLLDAGEVDALVTVMPIPAILPVARLVFARRIPVAIEKPLGRDLGEAEAIAAAAEETGAPVMVSFNRRFDPAVRRALDWTEGRGPLRAMHGSQLRHGRAEAFYFWGTAVHLLDLMCSVGGPLRLRSMSRPRGRGCTCTALLDGDDGLVASVDILPCCGRREERLRLFGDDYCVDIWTGAVHPWRLDVWHDGEPALHDEGPADQPEFIRSGAYHETEAFLTAILHGRPLPGPSPRDAMAATRLAAELEASPQGRGG